MDADGREWITTARASVSPRAISYRIERDGSYFLSQTVAGGLPFANLGGDPEQDWFADGVVDDIITALSRFQTSQ